MKFLRSLVAWLFGPIPPEEEVSLSLDLRLIERDEDAANSERLLRSLRPTLVREELERQLQAISNEFITSYGRQTDSGPHSWQWDWQGKAGREFEWVEVAIEHDGIFRVVAGAVETDPVFLYTCAHRTTPLTVKIQSLAYASAEEPMSIWIRSHIPFTVKVVHVKLRLNADVIRIWREKQFKEEGYVASLPAPDSRAGVQFYQDHPELIP